MRRGIAHLRRRPPWLSGSLAWTGMVTAAGAAPARTARCLAIAAAALLLAISLPAPGEAGDGELAGGRSDLTPQDRARVEAVTRPTSDFSRPEDFEVMQG